MRNKHVHPVMRGIVNSVTEPMSEEKLDFCLHCGAIVDKDKWREHMIFHKAVLPESPKNEDGTWKEFEYCMRLAPND